MYAEIISIGDELLIGQTINTNAAYIGQRLLEIGIETKWVSSVGDDMDSLMSALTIASHRADIVITTGGLGPTNDDMTVKIIAHYFESDLILNNEVLSDIKDFFSRIGRDMAAVNEEQAYVPRGAIVFRNRVGTAPALYIEKERQKYFVLPGVPHEMKFFLNHDVIPHLQNLSKNHIKYDVIKTVNIGESDIYEKLDRLKDLDKEVKFAFLPESTGVKIRLTSTGESVEECEKKIKVVKNKVYSKLRDYIWGENDDIIETNVVQLLAEKNINLMILEIFTGGALNYKLNSAILSLKPENKLIIHGVVFNEPDGLKKWFKRILAGDSSDWMINEVSCDVVKKIRQYHDMNCLIFISEVLYENDDEYSAGIGNVDIIVSSENECRSDKIKIRANNPVWSMERVTQIGLRMLWQELI